MKAVLIVVGIVFVLGALVAGCFAVVNDENSYARLELVSHRSEDPCEEYGDCEGDYQGGPSGGRYEGGRGGSDYDGDGDGNRCRNFCFYGVPLPGQDQPRSLFPPTPEGVRDFVLAVTKSGIEMGRLFADTTITFVSDLLIGLATAGPAGSWR